MGRILFVCLVMTQIVCAASVLGIQSQARVPSADGALGWNSAGHCNTLGAQSLQLLAMHAFSGCDTISYTYGKGKATALRTLLSRNFPGLVSVVGEMDGTQTELVEAVKPFVTALYVRIQGHQWKQPGLICSPGRKKVQNGWL